jgi:hypothetical protein
MNTQCSALLLCCVLGFGVGPAHAADRSSEAPKPVEESISPVPPAADASRAASAPATELDTCKAKARGLTGPRRSRFMTRCLKESGQ